jgi:phage shock protein PspC (stress-responsive transcriptional regulator)
MEKKLFRDINNKLLGGVSSGLACYFNLDVSLVRLLWVLLTICSGPWTIIVYTLMWIILPQGDSSAYNVEPDSEFKPAANNNSRGCFSGCLLLLFGLFVAFIVLFVLIITFSLVLGSFALFMGVISGDIALHEAIQTMLQ